ncbi:uncharacterized protein F4822DRAFT_395280 [Hypoxylon trugodes]|uniref:uncharacterized protein n=1 Tax=Hypoxylon trugodes TaxID=326681 RepID=UPI00218D5305|nr:uncharacterized protein F4822DRAFT_395280 [Hypoxylon trugodes]KAI1391037.1 hypothetical protein F4822DRAFT_395280 [Hypoxylon trugodes]
MFEVPDAKRVRREELYDSASDEEVVQDEQLDSTLRGKLNAQLSDLLDISFGADEHVGKKQPSESLIEDADRGPDDVDDTAKSEEEAFTFRLFRGEEPSHKVILKPQGSDAEKDGEGGFLVPRRPNSYYIADEPPPETAREFRMAAVSADYILQDAKKRRWGLEKPWKVTIINITTNKKSGALSGSVTSDATIGAGKSKKKRPGKKRRIILRVREKTRKEKEEASKHQIIEKEQHLKEKKQRMNRQKKLRKRAKQREEKKKSGNDDANSEHSRDSSPAEE